MNCAWTLSAEFFGSLTEAEVEAINTSLMRTLISRGGKQVQVKKLTDAAVAPQTLVSPLNQAKRFRLTYFEEDVTKLGPSDAALPPLERVDYAQLNDAIKAANAKLKDDLRIAYAEVRDHSDTCLSNFRSDRGGFELEAYDRDGELISRRSWIQGRRAALLEAGMLITDVDTPENLTVELILIRDLTNRRRGSVVVQEMRR